MTFLNFQGFEIQESVITPLFSLPTLPLFQTTVPSLRSLCHSELKTPIFSICPVLQSFISWAPPWASYSSIMPFLKYRDEKYIQPSSGESKCLLSVFKALPGDTSLMLTILAT